MLINYLAVLQIFINCRAIYIYFPKKTIEDVCAVNGEVLFGSGRYTDSHIPGEDSEVHGDPAPTGLASRAWLHEDTALFHISRVKEGAGFQVF